MAKSSDQSRWKTIDADRQHRGYFVRVSEEEHTWAEKEAKRAKVSIPGLLRSFLQDRMKAK